MIAIGPKGRTVSDPSPVHQGVRLSLTFNAPASETVRLTFTQMIVDGEAAVLGFLPQALQLTGSTPATVDAGPIDVGSVGSNFDVQLFYGYSSSVNGNGDASSVGTVTLVPAQVFDRMLPPTPPNPRGPRPR